MQFVRTYLTFLAVTLLLFVFVPDLAGIQQPKSSVVSANGAGTIRIGREEFKISAVVAKLLEDGTAEITLVSDISIFVSGTWSDRGDEEGIDVDITGAATKGGLSGNGKLLLSADRKSIAQLRFHAVNKQTERRIDVSFVGR